MELAAKKIKKRYMFSTEGMAELKAIHAHVPENVRLALNVFTTRDLSLARRLVAEKTAMREVETRAAESHFAPPARGPAGIDGDQLDPLDVIRDLKRINGHLTSVAYPILEAAGELAKTRLKASSALDARAGWVVRRLESDLRREPRAGEIDLDPARRQPGDIDGLAVLARNVAQADRCADRMSVACRGEIADRPAIAQQRLAAPQERLGILQHDRDQTPGEWSGLGINQCLAAVKPPGLSSFTAQPSPACHGVSSGVSSRAQAR